MVADRWLVVSPGPRAQIGSDQPSTGVLPSMMPTAEGREPIWTAAEAQLREVRVAPDAGQTVRA
jgi:hypothetical protein